MAVKDYLKKIGIHTCIYYTVATFFLLFLYFVLNRDLSVGLQVLPQICILPFALLFAIANVVFKYASFSVTWRVVLHYALTLGGSMLCLYLLAGIRIYAVAGMVCLTMAVLSCVRPAAQEQL